MQERSSLALPLFCVRDVSWLGEVNAGQGLWWGGLGARGLSRSCPHSLRMSLHPA